MAKTTVRPASASACMVAQKSRRAATSMPAVGSSRISRSGSGSSARANRSRCCSPPEHFATIRPPSSETGPVEHLLDGAGACAGRATSSTVSRTDRSRSSPPDLKDGGDAAVHDGLAGLAAPKTRAVPPVGVVRPRTMSSSGGLAGAVRAEQRDHLAGPIFRSSPRTACTTSPPRVRKVLESSAISIAGIWVSVMRKACPPGADDASSQRHDLPVTNVMVVSTDDGGFSYWCRRSGSPPTQPWSRAPLLGRDRAHPDRSTPHQVKIRYTATAVTRTMKARVPTANRTSRRGGVGTFTSARCLPPICASAHCRVVDEGGFTRRVLPATRAADEDPVPIWHRQEVVLARVLLHGATPCHARL